MPKFPGFIGPSTLGLSYMSSSESTTNFYVESADQGDALFPTPGFSTWSQQTVNNDVGARASCVADRRVFQLMGPGLYEYGADGSNIYRGAVTVNSRPGQIIYNGVVGGQLGVASGGNGYAFDLSTNVLSEVLTGDCDQMAYAAGYGFALSFNTRRIRLSNLDDLTTWDTGTFLQRSLFADPWQAIFVDKNNLLWTIGSETYEVWYNTGENVDAPWAPLQGLVGAYGIAAPFAWGKSASGELWLSRTANGLGPVVALHGSNPTPISTYPVSAAIEGYLRTNGSIDDAEMVVYQQEGHTFACLNFPTPDKTWCVDVEKGSWTTRGRWDAPTGEFKAWSPRTHVYAFGKHLIGDRGTAYLYEMDLLKTTEIDGSGVVRERIAPTVTAEHKRIPIDHFEILMDTGRTTQNTDPQMTLSVSEDGGQTWGNERRASIGRVGQYRKRVSWNRLGNLEQATLKVRTSDVGALVYIVDAYLNNLEKAA